MVSAEMIAPVLYCSGVWKSPVFFRLRSVIARMGGIVSGVA